MTSSRSFLSLRAASAHAALLTAALAAVVLVPTLARAARPSRQYTIEQLIGMTSVTDASFSPDEKRVLFSSNETGIYNVFSVPVAGGKATQLTRSATDGTHAVSYFPKDERILFRRDQGGNELFHLYVRTPDGQERDLTPGDKLRARFLGWSHDASAFYVLTSERDERFMDLYRYDAKTYARTLFFQNDGGYDVRQVSQEEMLRATSPLFHAEKIRKPLLVIQGANDPRVPKAQSDQIVEAVKKNNVTVDYLVLPGEGHGFSNKKTEVEVAARIRAFLDQHLKKNEAAAN